jgi:hypothetical protein
VWLPEASVPVNNPPCGVSIGLSPSGARDSELALDSSIGNLVVLRAQSCLGLEGGRVHSAGHPRLGPQPGLLHSTGSAER